MTNRTDAPEKAHQGFHALVPNRKVVSSKTQSPLHGRGDRAGIVVGGD
eukprot:CAMPEP_0194040338 /NCGR_PEP_ID=MMETSP0009_2-20130614/12363_1 /TAXON_ID=210454 /ORGANISM="Grammatophora oceanica, Strain CCMP 410" /LENGTH=47 /DNA_ID= /DNA_START= /DNA_END= /DNA_ORIENTATION=